MAPAAPGRRRMGACETTPPATRPRGPASDPPTTANPPGSSSLPMIGRRLPASSSFVLTAARLRALQLDTARAAAQTGSDEEKPQHQAPHPPAATDSGHRVRSARLLTAEAPMGAAMRKYPPIWSATWVARVPVSAAPEREICVALATSELALMHVMPVIFRVISDTLDRMYLL